MVSCSPLVSAEVDLTDFPFMPIMVARLKQSRSWLICKRKPELAFYLINLWTAAWHSRPAASLEDDDLVLADLAMCSERSWSKLKAEVLRGWIKCSDGRLYHPVVAEQANEAWTRKKAQRTRTEAARLEREKRRNLGSVDQPKPSTTETVTMSVTETVTDIATASKGQGQGQGQGIDAAADAHARPENKIEFDRLELDLREAAGLEQDPRPGLLDLSPVLGLIDAGFDLRTEVLPVIRARRKPGIRSWSYFVPMVHEARATRQQAAAPRPQSRDGPPNGRPTRGAASALAGSDAFDRMLQERTA